MRVRELLAAEDVRLVLTSFERTEQRPKGHGPLLCRRHDPCREIHRHRGSRNEMTGAEALAVHHGEASLGVILGPTLAAYDVDSLEGRAQLRAAGVDPRQHVTVRTPGNGHLHVYGRLSGKSARPVDLLGSDLRYDRWDSMLLAPGSQRGDGGKYALAAGRWGRFGRFPDALLSGNQLVAQPDPDGYLTPLIQPVGTPKEWHNQDHLESPLGAPIGHWDKALDWRLDDPAEGCLTLSQMTVRAVIIQAAQRHRRLAVDLGQDDIARQLGQSQQAVSKQLRLLLDLGALVMVTDDERGDQGYISPAVARATGGRSLVRSYVVPGLEYRVTDQPYGSKPNGRYGKRGRA